MIGRSTAELQLIRRLVVPGARPEQWPAKKRPESDRFHGGQRAVLHALEKVERRPLGPAHRIHRQQKRLFELILPCHHSIAHAICEGNSRRASCKLYRCLRRLRLVIEVRLHVVVQLEHQRVVRRPPAFRNAGERLSSVPLQGRGIRRRLPNRSTTASNGSPTRQDLPRPSGLTLLKTRKMRRPCTNMAGKLSMCSQVSSCRHVVCRPAISAGRKLARPRCDRPP